MIEEIWGSKAISMKPWKCMSLKTTSEKTPRKFAILFHVEPSGFRFFTWFILFLKFAPARLQFEVFERKIALV